MSWETNMLRVLAERQYYNEFSRIAMRPDVVSDDVRDCVAMFGMYFTRNTLINTIHYVEIVRWMEVFLKPKTQEGKDKHQLRCLLLNNVFKDAITEKMIEETRKQLCDLCYIEDASSIILQFNNGMLETDIMEAMEEVAMKYADLSRSTHLSPIRKDLKTILMEQDDEKGLTLPIEGLNNTVAPLKAGDFIVVGAQNNTGKTAFAVQCAVHFAKQLPPNAKILYLNNEGIGDHIILRSRQIALQLGKYALEDAFKGGFDIEKMYHKQVNGDSFKIEVIDIHGINVSQVQSLMRHHKPDVIIYDMLDAVHGFGGGGMDTDRYGQLYKWARASCANPEHQHIGFALTQVSHDGEGECYVPKHALEFSKVVKQAQADVLIMIGAKEEQPNIRYVWTPRCKRTRRGATESGSKFICGYDPDVGMYTDAATEAAVHKPKEEEVQDEKGTR